MFNLTFHYHAAALARAMRDMRNGRLISRNPDADPPMPLDWTDSDWFCHMWDKIIVGAAAASSKLVKKILSQDAAAAAAACVYNHFVVHRCLRADTAKIRNTPAERFCNCTFSVFFCCSYSCSCWLLASRTPLHDRAVLRSTEHRSMQIAWVHSPFRFCGAEDETRYLARDIPENRRDRRAG